MHKRMLVTITVAVSLAGAASMAAADTQVHFSGQTCQPQAAFDRQYLLTNGAGVTNFSQEQLFETPINVTCPASGFESATLTQTELKVRVYDGQNLKAVSGYWQINHLNLGTIWWSSGKSSCAAADGCTAVDINFVGNANLRWSGSELYGSGVSSFSNYSTYAFRATLPQRTVNDSPQAYSYLQAYWLTHVQP